MHDAATPKVNASAAGGDTSNYTQSQTLRLYVFYNISILIDTLCYRIIPYVIEQSIF